MSLKFRYSGIKEDGSSKILKEGFRSKGMAFVSASKSALYLRCHSNPNRFIRIEIQDIDGNILDDYRDHDWLKCSTE